VRGQGALMAEIKLSPLPGIPGWEMWAVREYATNGTTWHARPSGAPQAVVHADSVQGLAAAADEWLGRSPDAIDAAVAALRRQHDSYPEHWTREREHTRRLIETELHAALKSL
jgi:hypothetical protein